MSRTPALPPPPTFGLPASFAQWRPGQIDALFHATDAPVRFPGLILPTGFGKSLVYMAAAVLTGKLTVILTSTRALQAQLMRDYGVDQAIALVQGQRAYLCKALQPGGELHDGPLAGVAAFGHGGSQAYTVEDGPCHAGVECSLKLLGCGYYDAVRAAQHGQIVLANYAWWFTLLTQPKIRIQPELLVLDEAHAAPDALADALGASVTVRDVSEILRQKLPGAKDRTPEEWHAWASREGRALEARLDGARASNREAMKRIRRSQWLVRAFDRITAISPDVLLVSDEDQAVRFDVVWAAPFAEPWLFRHAPRVILTSATFNKHTAELLGIAPDDVSLYESGDGFPVDRRPVYSYDTMPVVRVDHRMTAQTEQFWLYRIDRILATRRDRKAIIHCTSYRRRDIILARADARDRMITHGKHDAEAQIAKFRAAKPGAVFVSPAVTTGYDFPYDDCEVQIVAKIPFPDSRDPVIAARSLIDPKYAAYVAMQELVQTVGRGMRAADDRCETFIIDDHSAWFLSRHADLAPRWFRRALERIDSLPTPPPPLGRRASHVALSTDVQGDS